MTEPFQTGLIDLHHGDRPIADVLDEVELWSSRLISGIFLDQAPADLAGLGAVALAVRLARRLGFQQVVLNPGRPVDPRYRELDAEICTFEGDWTRYQRWSGEGSRPGDGHLVYGVPPAQQPAAHRLLALRQAGLALVTAAPFRPDPPVLAPPTPPAPAAPPAPPAWPAAATPPA